MSPQDFARLLQDKLIEAGESRPLEFRVDLFGFVPRGLGVEQLFPLDNYYRHYLAAQGDGARQQAVKQFVRDWQARWGMVGAASLAGNSFAGQPPIAGAMPVRQAAGYRPARRPKSSAGRILLVVLGLVGLLFCLMCVAPCVLGIAMQNKVKNRPANFAGPRGFPGLPPPRLPQWQFQPPSDARVTEMLGGRGGGPRFYSDPAGGRVIGLAWSIDEWGGETALGSLQPLYQPDAQPERRLGREAAIEWARDGYVLGGLTVDANHYVNGVKATWVKLDGDKLDWTDTYESSWLGEATGRETRELGGPGTEVVGVALRQGIVVDSVGLVLKQGAGE